MSEYFADLRVEYANTKLTKAQLHKDPIIQTKRWLKEAIKAKVNMPNGASLATTDTSEVALRTILIKKITATGFIFFTNYTSKKALHIQQHHNVALLFNWLEIDRQIKISGIAEKIAPKDSKHYFYTRPKASQVAAFISQQSSVSTSRAVLEQEYHTALEHYQQRTVPMPKWGGYIVIPHTIEFWQGNAGRLHDRIQYHKINNLWQIDRLYP